jgi:hypothetical protein
MRLAGDLLSIFYYSNLITMRPSVQPAQTCVHLEALPDFSIFQFRVGKLGSIIMQLYFTSQRQDIYDLGIQQGIDAGLLPTFFLTEQELDGLILTVIGIIELYTGKYPDRVIRLRSGSKLQAALFRIILRFHHEILQPLFAIDKEGRQQFFPFRRPMDSHVFLLKRKPECPSLTPPVRTTLSTRSRLLGNPVHVELYKDIPLCS